jgi:hypothetical protein
MWYFRKYFLKRSTKCLLEPSEQFPAVATVLPAGPEDGPYALPNRGVPHSLKRALGLLRRLSGVSGRTGRRSRENRYLGRQGAGR